MRRKHMGEFNIQYQRFFMTETLAKEVILCEIQSGEYTQIIKKNLWLHLDMINMVDKADLTLFQK